MRPAGFLAPEFAEVVPNSIVSGFVEGFLGTFPKFIVPLGDLPYCSYIISNIVV